jgi:hypothetical protein
MFTVLSNTRNSNLFLIGALAIVIIALLTIAIVPAISAPQPAFAPAPRLSEAGSDFYQRHPDWTWTVSTINAVGNSALSDYFQRHPELTVPSILGLRASDYFQRHPELTAPADASVDMTDYFFRHSELSAAGVTTSLPESLETPGLACESPVDCR